MSRMRSEPLELRLAYDLVDLANGGDLLPRIRELRRQLATELGMVMPQVNTSDDATLPAGEYRISVFASTSFRSGTGWSVLALPTPPCR